MLQSHLETLLDCRKRRCPVALVTWLDRGRQEIAIPGERDIAGLEGELRRAIEEAFQRDRSATVESPDGEVFINVFNPALRMVVIGAVHIAQALCPMAGRAGYDVTVIDPRGGFATEARMAGVELIAEWPGEALERIGIDRRTAIVALTHDPKIDDPALVGALASEAFYIGALGSRRTHAKRRERLLAGGIDAATFERIRAPIGLDIGAEGPIEIALSILAEVTAVLRGKDRVRP